MTEQVFHSHTVVGGIPCRGKRHPILLMDLEPEVIDIIRARDAIDTAMEMSLGRRPVNRTRIVTEGPALDWKHILHAIRLLENDKPDAALNVLRVATRMRGGHDAAWSPEEKKGGDG